MGLLIGQHELGPEGGTLMVHTFRDGVAQRVGHDLVIEVERWWAKIEVGQGGTPVSIAFEVDPVSLRVRDGLRGIRPLTESDRAGIGKQIDEKILRGRPISFTSTTVEQSGDRVTATGQLTLVGVRRPARFGLTVAPDGRVTSTLPVNQSEWGIRPYRAFMGALKVRDTVEVVIDAHLPMT